MLMDIPFSKPKAPLAAAVALAVLAAPGLASCANAPAAEPQQHEEEAAPLTSDETKSWLMGSTDYVGRTTTITGEVFGIEYADGGVAYRIFTNPRANCGDTVVQYQGDEQDIVPGDYVRATGTIKEGTSYTTEYGAKHEATCLVADTIEESSYQAVVEPTLSKMDLNLTAEQKGYSMTLEKVEFAQHETRFYVTVENKGAGSLAIDGSAAVVQDGQQYSVELPVEADYPSIGVTMHKGASVSGILCFPKLEPSDLQLLVSASSNNYEQDGYGPLDYAFNVTIE